MKLEDLQIYQLAMAIADKIWNDVETWNYHSKDTVGKQLIRSSDSIAANISEGYGRFHFKENINFCYYSRGSLYETKTWLKKAKERRLIPEDKCQNYLTRLETLGVKLNNYINTLGKTTINSQHKL